MSDIRNEIRQAVQTLRQGGIILYPTDTVWGIGCDATDPKAVRRIFELKRRADHKAMIVLVDSLAKLERHADGIPEVAYDLIEASAHNCLRPWNRPGSGASRPRRDCRHKAHTRGILGRTMPGTRTSAGVDVGEHQRRKGCPLLRRDFRRGAPWSRLHRRLPPRRARRMRAPVMRDAHRRVRTLQNPTPLNQ